MRTERAHVSTKERGLRRMVAGACISAVFLLSLTACDAPGGLPAGGRNTPRPEASGEYTNYPGHMVHTESATYFVEKEYDNDTIHIFSIGTDEDAPVQEVYCMEDPWGLGDIRLRFEQEGILCFTETTFPQDSEYDVNLDIRFLDLTGEATTPITIKPVLSQGNALPDEVVGAHEHGKYEFTLDALFHAATTLEGTHMYSLEADGEDVGSAYLLSLDLVSGEVSYCALGTLGNTEQWDLIDVIDGTVYYYVTEDGVPVGIYRTKATGAQRSTVVEFSDEIYAIARPRIVGASLYYTQQVLVDDTPPSWQQPATHHPLTVAFIPETTSELHRFDLETGEDITLTISSEEPTIQCVVTDDTVYYLECGSLWSCDLQGDNNHQLIVDENEHRKDLLFTSGGWLYYDQSSTEGLSSTLCRIRLADAHFATEGFL